MVANSSNKNGSNKIKKLPTTIKTPSKTLSSSKSTVSNSTGVSSLESKVTLEPKLALASKSPVVSAVKPASTASASTALSMKNTLSGIKAPPSKVIPLKSGSKSLEKSVVTAKAPFHPSFKGADKVVYPGHGVGEILTVSTKLIVGTEQKVYEIKLLSSGMKITVPVMQAEAVGLRKVVDKNAVDRVYAILKDRNFKIDTQTWNRRFRDYTQKLETGSVFEIAEVIRDLSVLKFKKDLSFGEKKMLDKAEALLVAEIALSKNRTTERVKDELTEIFS